MVAICQPHNRDRRQWLRAAAELISEGEVNIRELKRQAKLERVDRVLAVIPDLPELREEFAMASEALLRDM